jgi:hypothetical protein
VEGLGGKPELVILTFLFVFKSTAANFGISSRMMVL